MIERPVCWTIVLLTLLLVTSTGCPSMSSYTTAESVGAGNTELVFAPMMNIDPPFQGDVMFPFPSLDVAVRHGLNERIDVGLRASAEGPLMVDVKAVLVLADWFFLALDPGVGGYFLADVTDDGENFLQYELPLLIDFRFSDTIRATLAVRFVGLYGDLWMGAAETCFVDEIAAGTCALPTSDPGPYHGGGAEIAVEFNLSDNFALRPFFSILDVSSMPQVHEPFGSLGLALAIRFP